MAEARGGDGVEPMLDAATLRRLAVVVRYQLAAHRAEIDALNVFPVADADTGTNLYLTFDGALDRVLGNAHGAHHAGSPPDADAPCGGRSADQPEDLLDGLARAMLVTARGNSGMLLSQVVRGLAETAARWPQEAAGITGADLAEAITAASDRAQDAVADPAPGTMLTVLDAAADAARRAGRDGGTVGQVAAAAAAAARTALLATREQLPENRAAGVVDAGGAGLVIVLEALDRVLHENSARSPIWDPTPFLPSRRSDWGSAAHDPDPVLVIEQAPATGHPGPAFEVMYRLEGVDDAARDRLAERLRRLGDSVLVVGDERLCTVHVHCADAGAAIEAGCDAGRPRGVSISVLDALGQGPGEAPGGQGAQSGHFGPGEGATGQQAMVLAVLDDPSPEDGDGAPSGLVAIARECGVRVVGPAALSAAVADGPVVLIPSSVTTGRVCRELAATDGRIAVVAAESIPQWVAVVAVSGPDAAQAGSIEEILGRLDPIAAGVRVGAVATPDEVASTATALLAEGGELVTVVLGREALELGPSIEAALTEALPGSAQVQVILGGQAEPLVAVGVE